MDIATDYFFSIVTYIGIKWITEKKEQGLFLCIGSRLDGGRSECELAVNCKEGAGFKRPK